MSKLQVSVVLVLLLIFCLRVYQLGGLIDDPEVYELETAAGTFLPLRDYLAAISNSLLPETQAALLTGMVLGVKEDLPRDFRQSLKDTSTIHIVVVSGQNLTMLSGFLMGLVGILGRKKTLMINLAVICLYVFLTGLEVPVLRASIMVLIASIAQFFYREADSFWILLLTALFMLIFNPNWLLSISFQLSFLATIGVVVLAPEVIKAFKSLKLPDIINQDLAVSLSAQALTIPIIALNFHQVSIAGLITNSLVLFTVPIIMISGIIAIALGIIYIGLGQILAIIPGIFLTYFIYIVRFFDQTWSSLYFPTVSPVIWIGYYIFILGIFFLARNFNKAQIVKVK